MTMKRLIIFFIAMIPVLTHGKHQILSPNLKSLQVVVNYDWLDMPIMTLGSDDMLNVGFDELSHNFHRFVVHLEHCEADWSKSEELFESDWLEGFNDWAIEDYDNSINTTVLYSHYSFQIPNEHCRLKASGNYRLHIIDEDCDNQEVLVAEFMVVEPLMGIGLGATTNTDVDLNKSHQQITMELSYNSLKVTHTDEQLYTVVMQNGREDNMRVNVKPNAVTAKGLRWEHNRELIFDAGNEYHRYEVLNPTHTTLGLDRVAWNEEERRYHVYPWCCEPQRNYLFYQDADGAFYIRNSDNIENDIMSDYVYVHYKLAPVREYENKQLYIDGKWTTEDKDTYLMTYDPSDRSYNATVLQKMGYYNYQILMADEAGRTQGVPDEGSFYQTENRYQAIVYYKGIGERTWRFVGYSEIMFGAD